MISNDSLEDLYRDLDTLAAAPLWMKMGELNLMNPGPKAVPFRWRYRELRPLLERAGGLIGTDHAERRVACLNNPGFGRVPFTVDTLFAGLQLLLPGEVARAHAHVPFALRFIIEGADAYMVVDGQRMLMRPGDLLLTPSFVYHDHGNETGAPMVWLDGIDTPFFQLFPVSFFRNYPEAQSPSAPVADTSPLIYRWEEMQARLDATDGSFAVIPYVHKQTGGAISLTVGAQAERLAAGSSSPLRRETASIIYHVRLGRGSTRVGETTLDWEQGDTVAVPAWSEYLHRNDGPEPAYLFRYDDGPALRALGLYRSGDPPQ